MLRLLNKKGLFGCVLALNSLVTFSQEGRIVLLGHYEEKDIFVQNPFAGTGVGFCVTKVLVNGKETQDSTQSSAFRINLSKYNFKYGDTVNIEIFHKGDCKPQVISDYSRPKDNFDLLWIKIDSGAVLKWKTKNEQGRHPFIIEQYRWNKWTKIGEVEGKGGKDENEYAFRITTSTHSGENLFRIKQHNYNGQPIFSKPVKLIMDGPPANKPEFKNPEKMILFENETLFEIYDMEGNIVKKGNGKSVSCGEFPKGIYYLNYDNKTIEFRITGKGELK